MRSTPMSLAIVVALVLVALGGVPASASGQSRANAVTDWNAIAASASASAGSLRTSMPLSLAMVQGAVYDAVNAIDGGHRPYLAAPAADPSDSKQAAAATAAFRVLVGVFPTQRPTLEPLYDASLAGVPDGPPKTGGIAAGQTAAAAMLAARANDGRGGPFTFVFGTTPGVWRPTPPNFGLDPAPWVGNVRPFLVPTAEMLRTDGPNALTSAAYAKDFKEVKKLGSLTSTQTNGGSDGGRDLLAGQRTRDLEPGPPGAGHEPGARHRRERPHVRDDEPGRGRRLDRLLERQVLLELLAADHGDPRGRGGRQPGDHGRPGLAPALRPERSRLRPAARHARLPRPPGRAYLHQRRDHCTRSRPSSAPTRSRSRRSATSALPRPARPGASTASRERSRRSSTLASGVGSTSAPPTCKGPCSARRSPTTCESTTSSRSTDMHPHSSHLRRPPPFDMEETQLSTQLRHGSDLAARNVYSQYVQVP